MSADKKNVTMDIEDKNQVVITPEDVQECAKFFQFFEIPVPAPLQAAIDNFSKDPTLQHQNELRYQLSVIIVKSDHPVFKDEVFNQVRPETSEVNEDLEFERQLEAQLTSRE